MGRQTGKNHPKRNLDLPNSEIFWTHRGLYEILNSIPLEAKSFLDVGCGRGIIGALLRIYRKPESAVGIDVSIEYLDFCAKMNFYDKLQQFELGQKALPFRDGEFDVATCIEVIEHLPKDIGVNLLSELERVAETVIITTPTFSYSQRTFDANPYQRHLSGWSGADFTKRGYRVRGIGEFMFFRRRIRYLSFFLSPFAHVMPRFSETLLACKTEHSR